MTPASTPPPPRRLRQRRSSDLEVHAGQASSAFAGPRATVALAVTIVLLLLALAVEGWYVWLSDDAAASDSRPVVTGQVAHRSGVEAASRATEEILSRSFKAYDRQVEAATALMTEEFAAEYRATVTNVKKEFVAARTRLVMDVVTAGVVRATSEEVKALLFMNQSVTRRGGDTSVTEYRALVTVVRTDGGWLVSDIETR